MRFVFNPPSAKRHLMLDTVPWATFTAWSTLGADKPPQSQPRHWRRETGQGFDNIDDLHSPTGEGTFEAVYKTEPEACNSGSFAQSHSGPILTIHRTVFELSLASLRSCGGRQAFPLKSLPCPNCRLYRLTVLVVVYLAIGLRPREAQNLVVQSI